MRSHHQHRRHAHIAQRVPAPQNGSPSSRTHVTPPALPTSRPSATRTVQEIVETVNTPAKASSTGILLGAPIVATQDTDTQPSATQQSSPTNNGSNNNSNNSDNQNNSPSPTQQSTNVVATSPADAPSTTFATSTFANDAGDTSYTTSVQATSQTTYSGSGSTTTNTATGASNSSGGMSTGGKIGLALGIIAIIGAFALFLMLFMAKKRKAREAQEKANDEKRAAAEAAAASAAAAAAAKQKNSATNAPRLSLRPVSRLVPDLIGGNRSKNRNSQGNMLTTFSESRGDRSLSPASNMQQSRTRENPFNDPVNPFNDPEKAAMAGGATAYRQGHGQAHELEDTRSLTQSSRPGTSHSQFPGAPSPSVATGPGPDQPAGNVYRILMEFKPTMEDELELIAGQHVRLLHEYDDGWALCIKLDRSQQGVVPRTCLAAKPSKPRPAPGQGPGGPNGHRGGPPGPQSRSITPSGPGGPRMNSPGFRSDSPAQRGPDSRPQTSGSGSPRQDPSMAQGNFNQAPRPLSPGPRPQMRSDSPGPYGAGAPPPMHGEPQRQRSNSASHAAGPRNSPPGRSNLGPVAQTGPGFAF